MSARLLGAHMPTSGGIDKAIVNGKKIGCTAVQVFTSSPQQWKPKSYSEEQVREFNEACNATGIQSVVSHDSYLINLCAPNPEIKEKSLQGLIGEMRRSGLLSIRYVVSHMGAHMGQGEEVGIRQVAESAKHVLDETPETVTLLMETTAGQGSALNCRFEHIAQILELAGNPKRLCVCMDTCHIFAAGYDIRTAESYAATMAEFDRLVGLDRIKAIHANDSKKPLGSKVDRHAHIGEGEIGLEAFRCLVNDPRFENVPILLETPEAETMHAVNLEQLMSLRAE